jgi:hypothetical protein
MSPDDRRIAAREDEYARLCAEIDTEISFRQMCAAMAQEIRDMK